MFYLQNKIYVTDLQISFRRHIASYFFKKANMYALKDCKKKFGCGLKGEKKFWAHAQEKWGLSW